MTTMYYTPVRVSCQWCGAYFTGRRDSCPTCGQCTACLDPDDCEVCMGDSWRCWRCGPCGRHDDGMFGKWTHTNRGGR